ncbi:VOC family protein [Dermacoccus sp. PE3]|uniref:VOC family protein n=1 Tax=Dermacoccus sp. PE3 TaxID=1641401 RepID=UPI0018CE5F3A|nr:hypothetical protein [Dermacoccus sp. PE3]
MAPPQAFLNWNDSTLAYLVALSNSGPREHRVNDPPPLAARPEFSGRRLCAHLRFTVTFVGDGGMVATGDLRTHREALLDAGAEHHRGPLTIGGGRSICQLVDPFGGVFGLDGPP